MKSLAKGIFLALVLSIPTFATGHAVELTTKVQDGLIAADVVRGQAVDRELFNGKPVLVVFFASW